MRDAMAMLVWIEEHAEHQVDAWADGPEPRKTYKWRQVRDMAQRAQDDLERMQMECAETFFEGLIMLEDG